MNFEEEDRAGKDEHSEKSSKRKQDTIKNLNEEIKVIEEKKEGSDNER